MLRTILEEVKAKGLDNPDYNTKGGNIACIVFPEVTNYLLREPHSKEFSP